MQYSSSLSNIRTFTCNIIHYSTATFTSIIILLLICFIFKSNTIIKNIYIFTSDLSVILLKQANFLNAVFYTVPSLLSEKSKCYFSKSTHYADFAPFRVLSYYNQYTGLLSLMYSCVISSLMLQLFDMDLILTIQYIGC